jgi:hypothetical protein
MAKSRATAKVQFIVRHVYYQDGYTIHLSHRQDGQTRHMAHWCPAALQTRQSTIYHGKFNMETTWLKSLSVCFYHPIVPSINY